MYNESELIGVLLGIFAVLWVFFLAAAILGIVALWKIFTKAGEEGWKSLIPIYNVIVLCQIVGVNPWWIAITYGVSIVSPALAGLGGLLATACNIYFMILVTVSLARAFGKDNGFAVGLYLLPIVFYPILAFSKDAKYLGNENAMNDFIFNKKEK